METQYCPQCGKANAPGFRFCQHCGAALTEAPVPAGAPATPVAKAPPPTAPTYVAQPQPAYPPQPITQMGAAGFSAVDIWGPFAGFGERGRHVSWLLDNLGERAEALREAVINRFRDRQIPGARIQPQTLAGKGIAVERRPYYLIRRGITTLGLYIARFGQDLYISQVTYVQGPINNLRVALAALMGLFQLYFLFGYADSLNSAVGSSFSLFGGGRPDTGTLGFLLCCIGPLGTLNTFALLLGVVFSVYKFLTDKDPLALLRTPPNEFQQDDIIALEKAVEETVRQSLDIVGIDSKLMPPASEYGIRRRLI